MLKDFKAFLLRGNVVDMAVGVIIGVAFGAIVTSLVNDVLMPPIGLAIGQIDFSDLSLVVKQGEIPGPYASVQAARAAGAVSVNYGLFINTVINFLIIAAVIFFIVIRPLARLRALAVKESTVAPATTDCPFCCSSIAVKATRCPHCTSILTPSE